MLWRNGGRGGGGGGGRRKAHMGEVDTPDTLGMLFKRHGLCLLANIPQLDDTLIITTDQIALHIAVPANAAQLGPAQSVGKSETHQHLLVRHRM